MFLRLRPVLLVMAASSIVLVTAAVGSPAARASSGTGYETREQFIYNLDVNLNVAPITPATQQFSDVPPTDPDYGYVAAAVAQGWISGLPNGTFDPQGPLTREAIAKIEVLALGDGPAAQALQGQVPAFIDGNSTPTWAWGYINEAVSLGILHGETTGQFDPGAYLTVAQETHAIAQILAYLNQSGSSGQGGGSQPTQNDQLVIANTNLTAGGPIAATLEGATGEVSWRLVEDNGYTFPLFGSTSATLNQDLECDIAENTYKLVAEDLTTGTSYSQQINVSSNYNFSVDTVTPSLVYNWQDMTPVYQTGIDGQGETIALYEESGYNESDIQQFDSYFGLPDPQIDIYGPNGQTQPVDTSQSGVGTEAAMDIEWAHAMAPLAKIVVYEEPPTASGLTFADQLDSVVQDANSRGFNALSISFGANADDPTGGTVDQEVTTAANNGLAIFASDGDHGTEVPGSTDWPSSNPDVVSVGGMQYDTNGVNYWSSGFDPNTGVLWAGGYGLTDYFAHSWQTSLGYNTYRIVPDVSFLANNAVMIFNGDMYTDGGTSLASPCWAGIWALTDQEYRSQNSQGISDEAAQVIYASAADAQDEPAFFQQQSTAATFYEGIGFGSPDVAAFIYNVTKRW